jgi:hypothetical protein
MAHLAHLAHLGQMLAQGFRWVYISHRVDQHRGLLQYFMSSKRIGLHGEITNGLWLINFNRTTAPLSYCLSKQPLPLGWGQL